MSLECEVCQIETKLDNSLRCQGICDKVFHFKCLKIQNKDYQVIQNVQGLKWYCDSCEKYVNCIMEIKKEMNDFKTSILEEMNSLKTEISINRQNDQERSKVSYAKVVAGEALIIKPKNKQESKKTQEMIKKTLKPSELQVGITQMRNIKDGGVLIKCKTKEDMQKFKKTAEKKLGKNYQCNIPEQKNPCIKVVDFEENLKEEELIDYIINQNGHLDIDRDKIKVIIIKKMKTRYMSIIECDPNSFKSIMEQGSLSIGWIPACRVFEYVKLFRCFKCGGYNHRMEECTCSKCGKCGESNHTREECSSDVIKCVNCLYANEKMNEKYDINHSVFDCKCPVYRQKIEMEKQKIRNITE